MSPRAVFLACAALTALTGCAVTVGSQSGSAGSAGINQDISSTRDNGPTSGNLEAPVSDKTVDTTTSGSSTTPLHP